MAMNIIVFHFSCSVLYKWKYSHVEKVTNSSFHEIIDILRAEKLMKIGYFKQCCECNIYIWSYVQTKVYFISQ